MMIVVYKKKTEETNKTMNKTFFNVDYKTKDRKEFKLQLNLV